MGLDHMILKYYWFKNSSKGIKLSFGLSSIGRWPHLLRWLKLNWANHHENVAILNRNSLSYWWCGYTVMRWCCDTVIQLCNFTVDLVRNDLIILLIIQLNLKIWWFESCYLLFAICHLWFGICFFSLFSHPYIMIFFTYKKNDYIYCMTN